MVKKKNQQDKLSESELDILKSFFPRTKELTLKEIMQKTGYSYEPINRIVHKLTKRKILLERKFGKTLVYDLNTKRTESKVAFYVSATERTNNFSGKHSSIFAGISEIPEEDAELIILFGSYAKGAAKKDSDIDLLIVSSNSNKVEVDITSMKRRYGLEVHPIIIPKIEFVKIKEENKELWDSLIENGIIFKGYEVFYHYAYTN